METNNDLESLLRMYIAGNNEIIAAGRKTKRRDNIMILIGFLLVMILSIIMIYGGRQSFLQNKYVLEHIETLNKNIDLRRRFLEYDRKDAADNLGKSVEILRYNDSIKRREDSLANVKFKKVMK